MQSTLQTISAYDGSSSAISKWEDTGDKLANALATYLRSCMFLEIFSSKNAQDSQKLASRIDFSLNTLHTKLSLELAQSRTILARMRNRILSRFHSIPIEILSAIFMNIVYAPSPDDQTPLPMAKSLKAIFGRLSKLLAVCSFWRNLAVSFKELWSIVPVAISGTDQPTHAVISSILERFQASLPSNRPLHLAATLPQDYRLVPLVAGYVPRFTSINIESCTMNSISKLLGGLLPQPASHEVSELSLHEICNEYQAELPTEGITDYMWNNRRLFLNLVGSLSILRLRSVNIPWESTTFSNKLVELRLQSVILDSNSDLIDVLQALQSAHELQQLKIISVTSFPDESDGNTPVAEFTFPNLKSLLLEDLDFNVLRTLLASIVPGHHRLTLFLTPKIQHIYELDEEPTEIDIQEIYELLERTTVDTLLLQGDLEDTVWLDYIELREILSSLPALKTLKMNSWWFNKEDLQALERPQTTNSDPQPVNFPNLEKICIFNSTIRHKKALYCAMNSHSLHFMELGGRIPRISSDDDATDGGVSRQNSSIFITHDTDIVRRLRGIIPHFRLLGPEASSGVDFGQNVWQLW
ncbi:hypothetical protein RSOLAG22IIIB_12737 [Rhizoctonia solani]|uniref:F-box domain-containing protein n=1 Tax=Rhizoctonia solani TaxID=456999 RepID=A0A0K6GFK9_9AGAM|nr:hypothetical protein RSOLAG22IIIB_12737 [Rhizoctonia solani]